MIMTEEEGMMRHYYVEIIKRSGHGQTSDDYHATVTRSSDGQQLVFVNAVKWILKLRTRRWFLERAFKSYDKYQAQYTKKETFRR